MHFTIYTLLQFTPPTRIPQYSDYDSFLTSINSTLGAASLIYLLLITSIQTALSKPSQQMQLLPVSNHTLVDLGSGDRAACYPS
jgi:hypothetical protein